MNENDFLLFDNVIHVDAGDNNLPFCKLNSFMHHISLKVQILVIKLDFFTNPALFSVCLFVYLSFVSVFEGDDSCH